MLAAVALWLWLAASTAAVLANSETICPTAATVFALLAVVVVVVAGSAFVGLCEGLLNGAELGLAGHKSSAVVRVGLGEVSELCVAVSA
jgi:hypothetical protein